MESQRVLKARKKFWRNLLIWLGITIFFIFLLLYEFPLVFNGIILGFGLITYIYSYICGYGDGKEHINSILDFMEPGSRWKVRDAEDLMYDKEDQDYYNSKNKNI